MKKLSFLIVSVCITISSATAETVYQDPKDFLKEVFSDNVPDSKVISIFGERREIIASLLTHKPSMLRVRYWIGGNKTVWILEEIGKTRPITTGYVVENGEISDVRVLIYRESHGAEVRHRFFTKQFNEAKLNEKRKLNKTIDGIAGATLSVNALRRLAAVALYLDKEVRK